MPVDQQREECAAQWETFVYQCYFAFDYKFPVTCLNVYDYDPSFTDSMKLIKDYHPVSEQSVGKWKMGMNLIASAKKPSSHQRHILFHIPADGCLDFDGWAMRGTNEFCYEEWKSYDDECSVT